MIKLFCFNTHKDVQGCDCFLQVRSGLRGSAEQGQDRSSDRGASSFDMFQAFLFRHHVASSCISAFLPLLEVTHTHSFSTDVWTRVKLCFYHVLWEIYFIVWSFRRYVFRTWTTHGTDMKRLVQDIKDVTIQAVCGLI